MLPRAIAPWQMAPTTLSPDQKYSSAFATSSFGKRSKVAPRPPATWIASYRLKSTSFNFSVVSSLVLSALSDKKPLLTRSCGSVDFSKYGSL